MKIKKNLTHWLSVIVIGIVFGFALQFVRAWTEPSAAPPGGNVGAPINTGAITQAKQGGLNIGGRLKVGPLEAVMELQGMIPITELGERLDMAVGREFSADPSIQTAIPMPRRICKPRPSMIPTAAIISMRMALHS